MSASSIDDTGAGGSFKAEPDAPAWPPEPPSVAEELGAMRKLVNALEPLDVTTRSRVLDWLCDRYEQSRGEL